MGRVSEVRIPVAVAFLILTGCARVGTPGAAPSPQTSDTAETQTAPVSEERPETPQPDRQPPATADTQEPQRDQSPSDRRSRDQRASDSTTGEPPLVVTQPAPERSPAYDERVSYSGAHAAWLEGPDAIEESEFADHEDIRERVDFWMEFWQGRGRTYFARYLSRMALYQPVIDRELMERNLPPTLRFLPLIESGYNPTAVSRVGATGLWQFMSPTARWLGLRVDGFVDERRDPFRSTETALDYLVALYDDFDSWYLALAAYNAGPGRIGGILRRNAKDAPRGDSLFWALSDKFPNETTFYVPKLMAAAELSRSPEKYGFERPVLGDSLAFERVDVQGTTSLNVVAEAAGASVEEVVGLNPHLVQRVTPLNTVWSVRVPPGSGTGFAARLALIPPEDRVTFVQHRVRSGETLGHIAVDYGIRLSQLRAANPGVRPSRLQIGQRLIIPKGPATSTTRVAERASTGASEPADAIRAAEAQTESRSDARTAEATTHVVRSGESPWTISRQYEVPLDDLLAWNDLNRGSVLRPGDELQVRGVVGAGQTVASRSTEYRVRSGDTLSEIAERHGISTGELIRHNGLTSRSVIRPGQTIRIPVA